MSDQGQTRSIPASLSDRSSKLSKELADTGDYDSGILSGPVSSFLSEPLSSSPLNKVDSPSPPTAKATAAAIHTNTYFDSGVIDDPESTSSMFLDKELIGLSDKVSNLKLDTSKSLNDLDQSAGGVLKLEPSIDLPKPQVDIARMCYRQNDEGDT